MFCGLRTVVAGALLLPLLLSPPAAAEGERIEDLWVQGESLLNDGKIDEALEIFSSALEVDKNQPRSWNYIGGIYFVQGDYLKALLNFKQAFTLDPGDARACNNIATAYEHLDQYDQAESYYLRAIEIDEHYPFPYRNLGILYAKHLGRERMARTYWEKFLELSPQGPGSDTVREALQDLDSQPDQNEKP